MNSRLISSESQIKARMLEIEKQERAEEKEREEAKKNQDFTQIYSRGWQRIVELSHINPSVVSLYVFFAENIDPSCGAVVVDQHFLAEKIGVCRRTIIRQIKILEKLNALVKIPIAGKVCAYALNPKEVWKGYNNNKDYAAFNTKTLVNKDGEINRRLKLMFNENNDENNNKNTNF